MRDRVSSPDSAHRSQIRTWLALLIATSLPLLLLGLVGVKWYRENAEMGRLTSQFMQRQNRVLAYDAMRLAREISKMLERVSQDAQSVALIESRPNELLKFYQIRQAQIAEFDTAHESRIPRMVPVYHQIVLLNDSSDEVLKIRGGKLEKTLTPLSRCLLKDLCDPNFRKKASSLPVGGYLIGRVMRYYTGEPQQDEAGPGFIELAYRTPHKVVVMGIDYLHFLNFQGMPRFPYEPKAAAEGKYDLGNYVYLVDSRYDIFLHPKKSHVMGIDRETGEFVSPIRTDEDEGKHPLNISAYRGERLKIYFERLLRVSFNQNSVDIFRASNLKGVNRVLSVTPITFKKGQFEKTGVFGHVIVGCSVERFEEPKEKFVPYY